MVSKSLFSSNSAEWETPARLFEELQEEYYFNLDVCATPENAKCAKYFTKEQDGLSQSWDRARRWWCNPPYGRDIGKWVEKAISEWKKGNPGVMLLPARTDTKWFHTIYKREGIEIRFLRGRLKFVGAKHPAPFPSMVVVFHD